MFKKKEMKEKKAEREQACRYCEFAVLRENGAVFCQKKRKERAEQELCHSFVYDLLKRTPAMAPDFAAIDWEALK